MITRCQRLSCLRRDPVGLQKGYGGHQTCESAKSDLTQSASGCFNASLCCKAREGCQKLFLLLLLTGCDCDQNCLNRDLQCVIEPTVFLSHFQMNQELKISCDFASCDFEGYLVTMCYLWRSIHVVWVGILGIFQSILSTLCYCSSQLEHAAFWLKQEKKKDFMKVSFILNQTVRYQTAAGQELQHCGCRRCDDMQQKKATQNSNRSG